MVSPLFAIADVERALVTCDVSRRRWVREIGEALWRGDIVALSADDLEAAAAPTFLEIQLIDRDDNPVPRRPFRVRLPNGELRSGVLDDLGFARIDDIELAGACAVWCPFVDVDEQPVSRPTGGRHAFVLDDRWEFSLEDTYEHPASSSYA